MSQTGSENPETPRSTRSNGSRSARSAKSATSSKGRHNKIYRCPPTPPPPTLLKKEGDFVLDCRAVSSISQDYSKANPKLGPVISPYNSKNDKHVNNYFQFIGVNRTLKRTGQEGEGACSIDGKVMDRFYSKGAGYQYLQLRNDFGAGHSREMVDGHAQFMQGIKPNFSYNGKYGYRRNNPWLRREPSTFGTAGIAPLH